MPAARNASGEATLAIKDCASSRLAETSNSARKGCPNAEYTTIFPKPAAWTWGDVAASGKAAIATAKAVAFIFVNRFRLSLLGTISPCRASIKVCTKVSALYFQCNYLHVSEKTSVAACPASVYAQYKDNYTQFFIDLAKIASDA